MRKIYRIGILALVLMLTLSLGMMPVCAASSKKSADATETTEATEETTKSSDVTSSEKDSAITITIQNAISGEQYSAYLIFEASASTSSKAVSYIIRTDSSWFADVVAYIGEDADDETGVYSGQGLTLTPKTGGKSYTVVQGSDFSSEDFADYLSENASNKTADATANTEDGVSTLDISDCGKGYYLIQSGLGSFLSSITESTKITEKNASPTVTLEVEEASAEESPWGTASTAQIGDYVVFRASISVLDGDPQDYVLHVTLGDGFSFTEEDISEVTLNSSEIFERQADTLTEAASYAVITGDDASHVYLDGNVQKTLAHTFDISLDNLLTNDTVVVTFQALVTDADADSLKTTAYLTCTDYKGEHTSATSAVAVTTCSVTLSAVDTNGDPLAGGTYRIYRSEDDTQCVSFAESETDGKTTYIASADGTTEEISLGSAEICGLDAGTYYLEQLSAPDGYEGLEERLELTVSTTTQTITIESTAGVVLPTTGGMGSLPFYLGGGLLMLLSLVGFIARKKPSATV